VQSLKRVVHAFFYPTIWLADRLSILQKFLLFLGMNLSILGYLSLAYITELENKVQQKQERIEALALKQKLFTLMISLQKSRSILNKHVRADRGFQHKVQVLHHKNPSYIKDLDLRFEQVWIDKRVRHQWKNIHAFVSDPSSTIEQKKPRTVFHSYTDHIAQVIQVMDTLDSSSYVFPDKKAKNAYYSGQLLYAILPKLMETQAQTRDLGTRILNDKTIREDDRQSLIILRHKLLLQERSFQEYIGYYTSISNDTSHQNTHRFDQGMQLLERLLSNHESTISNTYYFNTFTDMIKQYALLHTQLNTDLYEDLALLKKVQEQDLILTKLGIWTFLFFFFYWLVGLLISAQSFSRAFLKITQKINNADFHSRLNVPHHNEYGKMAQLLNHMIDNLDQNAKMIDKYIDISETDLKGTITYVSSSFMRHCGYSKEELIGNNHNILRHPQTPDETYSAMWSSLSKGETWEGELRNRRKDGSDFWTQMIIAPKYDETLTHKGYISIRRDISDLKHIEELSITDYLTQIYNRKYFNEKLKESISLNHRYQTPFSLLMFDIDFFKKINDKYGHLAGDECLVRLCKVVNEHLRENDTLARWGGEEFMILLAHTKKDEAVNIAQKLRALVERHIFDEIGKVTISFGVSSFLREDTFDTVLERCDKALYKAKDEGRNKVVYL